jgi:hypothetical protein
VQNEVSDAEALENDSSLQFQALRWLAKEDPVVLDLDSTPTVIIVEQYVLAVPYFATGGEGWWFQGNFLSATSVCEWKHIGSLILFIPPGLRPFSPFVLSLVSDHLSFQSSSLSSVVS